MNAKVKWAIAIAVVLTLMFGAYTLVEPILSRMSSADYYDIISVYATFDELLDNTEAVVTVKVLSKKEVYVEKDFGVHTISEVRVDRTLFGEIEPGTTFTMRIRGGTADGVSTRYVGTPSPFEPDTEHLLFVKYDVIEERPDLNGWHLVAGFQSRAEIVDGKLVPIVNGLLPNPMRKWKGKTVSDVEKAIKRAKAQP